MDINLSNVNPVIHVPGTVLAVSTMQNFDTVLGQEKKNYSSMGSVLARLLLKSRLPSGKKKSPCQGHEHRPLHRKL